MLIDTHCHLTDERFMDVGEVLKLAFDAGVEKVIMPSTSIEDAKKAVQIAERFEQYCLVGIHPEEVEKVAENAVGEMEEIIKSSRRVVGVGEIGLDFYYDKERKTKDCQVKLFRAQMEMAQRNNLPVAIHMRDAEEEMKEEIELIMKKYENPDGFPIRSAMTHNVGD